MKLKPQNRTVFTGDNLHILRKFPDSFADLIYLDPPFNTRKQQRTDQYAYEDQWNMHDLDEDEYSRFAEYYPKLHHVAEAARYAQDSHTKAYLIMMSLRLRELHRVLKPTGSLYLHCDPKASHYLKMVLDVIFGMENFINEIIWCYGLGGSSKRFFSRKHDTILFYSKTGEYFFNKPLMPSTSVMMAGNPKGMVDYWNIPTINNMSHERVGYPTQKPLALVERIIQASSKEGDMVLDPFCGCVTAGVAAERLGRKWIGIDQVEDAYDLMVNRLVTRGEGGEQMNLLLSKKGVNATELFCNLDADGKTIKHKKIKTMEEIHASQNKIKKTRERTSARISKESSEIIPLGKLSDAIPIYRENKDKSTLYGRQRGHCNGCGDQVRYDWMQVDHIKPKSQGGADNITNYQLLCPSCNQIKGNGTQEELIKKLKARKRYER